MARSRIITRGKVRFVSNPYATTPATHHRRCVRGRTSSASSTASSPRRSPVVANTKLYSPGRLSTRLFVSKALSADSDPFIPRANTHFRATNRPRIDTPTVSPSRPPHRPTQSARLLRQVTQPSPALTDISTFSTSSSFLSTPHVSQDGFDASSDSISFVYEPVGVSDEFVRGPTSTAYVPYSPSASITSPQGRSSVLSPFAKPFALPSTPTQDPAANPRLIEYVPRETSFAPVPEEVEQDESQSATEGTSSLAEYLSTRSDDYRERRKAEGALATSDDASSSASSKKRKPTSQRERLRGKRIPVMVGPESLPYARNPS